MEIFQVRFAFSFIQYLYFVGFLSFKELSISFFIKQKTSLIFKLLVLFIVLYNK